MQAKELFATNFTFQDVKNLVQWMINFGVLKGSIGHGKPLVPSSDVAYISKGGWPQIAEPKNPPKTNPYIKTQVLPVQS